MIDAGTNRQSLLDDPNYLGTVMNVFVGTVIMHLSTNLLKQQNVYSLNYTYIGKILAVEMQPTS